MDLPVRLGRCFLLLPACLFKVNEVSRRERGLAYGTSARRAMARRIILSNITSYDAVPEYRSIIAGIAGAPIEADARPAIWADDVEVLISSG